MEHSVSDMSGMAMIAQRLGRVFDESLNFFAKDEVWKGRTGAYFCLADAMTGMPLMVLSVGTVPLEKGEKYLGFCIEKAKRLAAHPEHLASWESRNPKESQFGGAVRGNYIYSLSGLPELGDEAVMLVLLHNLQPGNGELFKQIAQNSGNPYYTPLLVYLDLVA